MVPSSFQDTVNTMKTSKGVSFSLHGHPLELVSVRFGHFLLQEARLKIAGSFETSRGRSAYGSKRAKSFKYAGE